MKVILLIDVPKIGKKDDVLDLKDGFAHNVLISKGKAVLATPQALSQLEAKKAKRERERQEENKIFASLVSEINNKKIAIKSKANDKGVLFKSVTPRDVSSAIKNLTGESIDDKYIIMDHIKTLGKHMVIIKKGSLEGECEIIVE
jgi:large subunit ribosomal protein L9